MKKKQRSFKEIFLLFQLKSIKRDCNKDSKDESQPEYTFFSIDCDQQSQPDTHELHHMKVQPVC